MRDACIVGKTFLAPRQLCGGVGGRNQVDPYRSKRAERMAHGGVRKDQSSSFLLYSAPFLLFVLVTRGGLLFAHGARMLHTMLSTFKGHANRMSALENGEDDRSMIKSFTTLTRGKGIRRQTFCEHNISRSS